MPPHRTGLIGVCPQCRTLLRAESDAEGRNIHRCPKCGWSDLETAGLSATPVEGPPEITPAPARARSARAATIALAAGIAILGAVMALFMALLKGKG